MRFERAELAAVDGGPLTSVNNVCVLAASRPEEKVSSERPLPRAARER